MSWVQRGLVMSIVGIGALIALKGGSTKAGLDPRKSPMKGAVYATAVPVYPGAKLDDVMGGNYYDDIGGPVTFTSKSWFFTVKAPMQKVVDFYSTGLPTGAHREEAEEGSVRFKWAPPGSADGEAVEVWISEGSFHIGETIKAK